MNANRDDSADRYGSAHFDALHAADDDPWQVRTSWYERRKLAVLLAGLPRERYRDALELGCSVGATTAALAGRCDAVLAVDRSRVALRHAAAALDGVPGVTLQHAVLPDGLPAGEHDLVVLAETGYFLAPDDVDALARALPSRLAPGGDLVAMHWRHDADRLATPGDEVHRVLDGLGLRALVRHEEDDFLLQVWRLDGDAPGAEVADRGRTS
ncbi:SAM-dependent methyltransferase [Thalassiella azotivora]